METPASEHHHHHESTTNESCEPQPQPPPHISSPSCLKCGAPTAFSPPPLPDPNSLPAYRPIRFPAINLPPDSATKTQQSIILSPVPQPSPVPPLSPPFNFIPPTKRISSPKDASYFVNSSTGKSFLGFIAFLSYSIRGHKISDPCPISHTLSQIISFLDSLISLIHSIPPAQQSSRYGNLSFRVWHEEFSQLSHKFMLDILPNEIKGSSVEILPYFLDSFGNSSRIDYGTGHETNFAAWLYCLARLGLIKEEDYQAVVSRVFVKYLDLMRKLQLVYCLEPAGSHGVWGLDDYHFLPFVFGSAQLIDHKYMKPKSIHNDDILENFSKEYMYLSCIAFIKKVKKGPFSEHSPLLDDISGVPNWNKVNSGMLKMYRAEVLEKVPVVQHFLFGSIIPWE
ncbi:uncharacterized protein LOC130805926 [Amaranthus tricolor]|uniref:uncharacterized protein LOC130805926 n=1 Tax=Amaranthus tricolor TaxID=29722 RepID=UPI00258A0375|nr:uncharacterized protein LOC130805926 [Amaranthus tricolor]